jgi:hypothetical protein
MSENNKKASQMDRKYKPGDKPYKPRLASWTHCDEKLVPF